MMNKTSKIIFTVVFFLVILSFIYTVLYEKRASREFNVKKKNYGVTKAFIENDSSNLIIVDTSLLKRIKFVLSKSKEKKVETVRDCKDVYYIDLIYKDNSQLSFTLFGNKNLGSINYEGAYFKGDSLLSIVDSVFKSNLKK